MVKLILKYGLLALVLFVLLELSQFSIYYNSERNNWLVILMAIVLIGFGVFTSRYFFNKKKKILATQEFSRDENMISKLGLSNREIEVLDLISKGMSNQEIAEKLFIAESTVKTHISRIFNKLDAKRRTQAITKAKDFKIIP